MGKILGLRAKVWAIIGFVALVALVLTMFYNPKKGEDVSAETMEEIQSNLQDQIFQILNKRSDEITNIKFEKFWTEQLTPHTIKANFVISYEEPLSDDTGRILREGSMILSKLDETTEEQVWIADVVNVNGEQITFENGLKFKAGDADEEDVVEEGLEYDEDGPIVPDDIDGESFIDESTESEE